MEDRQIKDFGVEILMRIFVEDGFYITHRVELMNWKKCLEVRCVFVTDHAFLLLMTEMREKRSPPLRGASAGLDGVISR